MLQKFIPGSSYRSPENKRGRKRKFFLYAAVLLLVIAFLFRLGFPSFVSSIFSSISRPFLSLKNTLGASGGNILGTFYSKETLLAENRDLNAKLQNLQGIEAEFTLVSDENAALRKSIGVASNKNDAVLSVILKPPASPYDTLILDGGQNDAIKKSDIISGGAGVVLGEITEVSGSSSKAEFFSSSGRTLLAELGTQNIPLTLSGIGGGNFESKLPKSITLNAGDPVYLPGMPQRLVGIVSGVVPVPNDSYDNVYIRVPVNIFELSFVTVERGTLLP